MARKKSRWVVKAGSQMVCEGGPLLIRSWMHQVAALKRRGVEIVWVTSGAIAGAVERTGFRSPNRSIAEKQALSAIGQPLIMDLYNLALQSVGCMGAQALLTYDDFKNSTRKKNLENTLVQLMKWNAIPILNENDVISTEEIQFGDNDSLSAKVARLLKADRLVVLTDVEGLFDKDPKKHKDARIIHHLASVSDQQLRQVVPKGGSVRGTGGMYSKLRAAREALEGGIETWLVKGDHPQVLLKIHRGEPVGTLIGGSPS